MPQDPLQVIEMVKRDIEELKRDLSKLERSLDSFREQYIREVTSNISTWNATSGNINRVVWIVIVSVIAAVLALIGLK